MVWLTRFETENKEVRQQPASSVESLFPTTGCVYDKTSWYLRNAPRPPRQGREDLVATYIHYTRVQVDSEFIPRLAVMSPKYTTCRLPQMMQHMMYLTSDPIDCYKWWLRPRPYVLDAPVS